MRSRSLQLNRGVPVALPVTWLWWVCLMCGQPGPVNNNFVAATVVTVGSSYTGTTVGATHETSETTIATGTHSILYNWVSTGAGTFTFQTLGTSWDTELGVYANSTGKLPATLVRCIEWH